MKRLWNLVVLAVALLASLTPPASAGNFGLTYSRNCNACSAFCVRPYNAFSSVTCGVASNEPCNKKACDWCQGPSLYTHLRGGTPGMGSCGAGGCGVGGHGLGLGSTIKTFGQKWGNNWVWHKDHVGPEGDGFHDDGSLGAFGGGAPIKFFGSPTGGYSCKYPGCNNMAAWEGGTRAAPGHEPPAGPPVAPYMPRTVVWLPQQPFPGVYGFPNPMVQYPVDYSRYIPTHLAQHPGPVVAPAAYQQTHMYYGAYQPVNYGAYNGYPYGYQQPTGYYYGYGAQQPQQ